MWLRKWNVLIFVMLFFCVKGRVLKMWVFSVNNRIKIKELNRIEYRLIESEIFCFLLFNFYIDLNILEGFKDII